MKYYKSILLGSAGTGAAYSSAVSLRKNWGDSVKIISADINPANLVTASLLADKHIIIPLNIDNQYNATLLGVLINENINTYIPFIDQEIFIAAQLLEKNPEFQKISLQVKSSQIADLCNDKYKTFIFLSENNILTPDTHLLPAKISKDENYIIKPRKGFGSKIIRIPNLLTGISDFNSENFIFQHKCDKPEITVDVCFDKSSGFFKYICRERIEVKSGVCTKARLFYDEKIELIAFQIAEKLSLSSFCFQIMNYNGEYAVTDINARLGAGTAMSVAAGFDFFSSMFAILWGDDPSVFFRPLQKEIFVTRQYSDFVMNL